VPSSNIVRCAAYRDRKGKASALADADRLLLRTFARRCGVHLALVALTLQLALSIGHVHRRYIAYPNFAYSRIEGVAGWQAPTKLEVSKQLPSPLADDDEPCSICFSASLLSTCIVPAAPQHAASSDFKDVDRFFGPAFDIARGSDRPPFQSRAPPLV
jgi:hypothetical protein